MKYFILALILVVVVGGIFFLNNSSSQPQGQKTRQESAKTQAERKVEGYEGGVIAGNSSPYLDFKQGDYEKALQSDKVVFLNFFANWCPVCRAEAPDLNAAFNSFQTERIIGFRVNYNDSETDENEKKLAQQFGITYQHTKVVLVNGREMYKATEQWDEAKTHELLGRYR